MKKIFSLLLVVFVSAHFHPLQAQLRKVPGVVTDALKAKYPAAEKVEWKDKITVFQADFEIGGTSWSAKFNSKGEWQSSEKIISESDLPATVKDGFDKSKYSDWELRIVSVIYLPEDKMQYHLFVAKSDLQKKNLLFNPEGKLLRDSITL
jgi:hypothetical protein